MGIVETVIRREPWDVDHRLAELSLDRRRLMKVVAIAISAGADATEFHPANAAGTFSYQHGTWALRDAFVGDGWALHRPDGVEAIRNDRIKVTVAFANVDVACTDQPPKPRSHKGAGAERVFSGNLFDALPHYVPSPNSGWSAFYLMVDRNGAVELSRPVIENNTFRSFVERNFISYGDDFDRVLPEHDDRDGHEIFDPQVSRKR